MDLTVIRHRAARTLFGWRLTAARTPRWSWRTSTSQAQTNGITLITVAFNNPVVIDAQAKMLRKWLVDPFRHVVVDNSPLRAARQQIRAACLANSLEYFKLPKNPYTGRDPSFSHAEALNYTVRNLPDIDSGIAVGFLDHDVFPTKRTSVLQVLESKKAYGRQQFMSDGWYLWPGLTFFRCDSIDLRGLDFSPIRGHGDTGARIHSVLRRWSEGDVSFTRAGVGSIEINGIAHAYELHDDWAHTLSASGWRGQDTERNAVVIALLQELGRL